jgi:hypothetical protein
MPLGYKFNPSKLADRQSQITAAREAVAALDTIIAGVVGSTTAQTQNAIKSIAQHQKALIKITVQQVT